jgi:hypothetical protein
MKKSFKSYFAVWLIGLLLFNAIAFIVPHDAEEHFWLGYFFISLAFLGQLLCAEIAFRAKNQQKFFYRIPLISISLGGTLLMVLIGGLVMAIPALPIWLGAILCLLIAGFSAIGLLAASAAGTAVGNIDDRIKGQTLFIKMLTSDAERLIAKAQTAEQKATAEKIYEALRFSDPTSAEGLNSIEAQITLKFKDLEDAVAHNETVDGIGKDLLILIEDRNAKCKLLK